jgi:hypothetical protein
LNRRESPVCCCCSGLGLIFSIFSLSFVIISSAVEYFGQFRRLLLNYYIIICIFAASQNLSASLIMAQMTDMLDNINSLNIGNNAATLAEG